MYFTEYPKNVTSNIINGASFAVLLLNGRWRSRPNVGALSDSLAGFGADGPALAAGATTRLRLDGSRWRFFSVFHCRSVQTRCGMRT